MPPVRPSALSLARHCAYSAKLAAENPEGSAATERGTAIHEEIAAYYGTDIKKDAISPEARAAIRWLEERFAEGWELLGSEVSLELRDVDADEEPITEGTADCILVKDATVMVVDFKTGQRRFVEPAAENMQLKAYGCAALTLEFRGVEFDAYVPALLFLDGDVATADIGPAVGASDAWGHIDVIKDICAKPPVPVTGPHCEEKCFRRHKCPAFLLPAYDGPSALIPFTERHGLTKENAFKALRTVEAMESACKKARAQLESFADEIGGIVDESGNTWGPRPTPGRRTGPSFETLEREGLGHLIKPARPGTAYGWRKAAK